MRDVAEGLGFVRGDRYLTATGRLRSTSLVVAGPRGAVFEQDGKGLGMVVTSFAPDGEWLASARSAGEILVIFGVPRRDNEYDLRQMLGTGRAFCGWADAVVVTDSIASPARYELLGLEEQSILGPMNQSVLLDSNVLVHMEKAANGMSRDQSRDRDVQNAVLSLIHQDVLGAFGIGELAWDRRSMTWDELRARKLRATIDAWFDGGARRARDITLVQQAYQREMAQTSPEIVAGSLLATQMVSYACLLKIAALWCEAEGQYRARQRVELYSRFAVWMRDELDLILSYPLQVARDRFVGPQQRDAVEYIDRLLKLGQDPLRDLWGAAWDLVHLSNVDQAADPDYLDNGGRASFLLTGDAALPHLRKRLRLAAMSLSGERPMVLMRHAADVDKRLNDQKARIESTEDDLREHALGRIPSDPSDDRLLELVRIGESELLLALKDKATSVRPRR